MFECVAPSLQREPTWEIDTFSDEEKAETKEKAKEAVEVAAAEAALNVVRFGTAGKPGGTFMLENVGFERQ